MSADAIVTALALPPESRVDQRVPKKLLLEQSIPTAADKRQIQDGIDELWWVAALKPSTVGVPEFRDPHHEYLEIAVLTVAFRPAAKSSRLIELIHRAIPYPLVLISTLEGEIGLSLAHKRFSQSEGGTTVLDGGTIHSPAFRVPSDDDVVGGFLASLALSNQPRSQLHALYQGWIERIEAFHAARLSGRFEIAAKPEIAEARRRALEETSRLQREITGLRALAAKEKQINRRVDLNLTIRRLEAELATASENL